MIIKRILQFQKKHHFFLFGPRGCGKSTLLRERFAVEHTFWIDLLDAEQEDRYSRTPNELIALVNALPPTITTIIIDEIQKIPKLLDIVHLLIESKKPIQFILTGSSARKLKHNGANLLAGRAFVYHLFPFSFVELADKFNLQIALEKGLLPRIVGLSTEEEYWAFLQAYTNTYLKEEIWSEHFVKNLNPFRKFLEVAAQCNGKIINIANIARDVHVSDKTVIEYFTILEDTLVGFFLEPFHHSFRKRLNTKPKFYFFDTGVVRALARLQKIPLKNGTSMYGEVFEHFIINECIKLATYYQLDYRFSYLATKDGAEIDLIVDRPGQPYLFIEIKSTTQVVPETLRTLRQLSKDFQNCEAVCFSQDPYQKRYDDITIYPWKEGICHFFMNAASELR